jgi:predicted lipoprotein with Yx(FWY)xxD motif
MRKLIISSATIAATLAAAVALAACGGGGSGGATAAAPSASGKTVSVQTIGGAGSVLVDSSGHALYASDQETAAGKVLCTGACNSFWKPLTVTGGAPKAGSVAGKLGVLKRPDGTKQVTYNGKLLYSFTQEGPGQVTGDGFHDAFDGRQFTWHVISVGGGAGSSSTASGGNGPVGY